MSRLRRWPAILAVFAVVFGSLTIVAHAEDSGTTTGGNELFVTVTGAPIADIASDPLALTPTYAPGIVDYVWRCQSGTNALQVTLTAIAGGMLHISGQQGSSLTINENLLENQALVITGPWSHGFAIASGVAQSDEERSDEARGHTDYWIRCLPHDFPQLSVSRLGSPPEGWYLTGNLNSVGGSGIFAMVLDTNGTPVWYRRTSGLGALNVTSLEANTITWMESSSPFGVDPTVAFKEYDLRTRSTAELQSPIPPTDGHELLQLSSGDRMMLATPVRYGVDLSVIFGAGGRSSSVIDCVVQDVKPNGQLRWEWRASDHIRPVESQRPVRDLVDGQPVYDIYHCNSVDVDPESGDVLLSLRHADAVYLISRETGAIIWKLGGIPVTNGEQSLAIRDDPLGAFHAQHDARFEPNGDISLFDNETWNPDLTARATEYHVDLKSGTARLVWSFTASDGHNSGATGSFRRMSGGADNVIGWGFMPHSLFTEVDANGRVLMDVAFPNSEVAYRVIKVMPSAFSRTLLRATAGGA